MQYSQEHLKTMVYAKFGGQTECIMGNSKKENASFIHENYLVNGFYHRFLLNNNNNNSKWLFCT